MSDEAISLRPLPLHKAEKPHRQIEVFEPLLDVFGRVVALQATVLVEMVDKLAANAAHHTIKG